MPLASLCFYLESKFEHETRRHNYMADMAMYAAWGNVKDAPTVLPRYWDMMHSRPKAAQEEHTVEDVISMFGGE